jgi:hypothetical protein
MKVKRKIVAVALLLIGTLLLQNAGANFVAPPWHGNEGTTLQEWDFLTDDTTPPPNPDTFHNPYGDPALRVSPLGDWIPTIDNRNGIWPLSGEIDVYIPNRFEQLPVKHIWLQLAWRAAGNDQTPFLPDEPVVGITSYPLFESMNMSRQDILVDDWTHSLFLIDLYPNPQKEWITIKGDILVDRLSIETICIPEPTAIVMLGLGLMVLTRKRRKRFEKT